MGYGPQQVRDLEHTIRSVDCDLVMIATPVDLRRIMKINQPTCRVTYEFADRGRPTLREALNEFILKARKT